MKKIDVSIEGLTALMMSNPASMLLQTTKTKSSLTKSDPKKEAEEKSYRDEKGYLYIPSRAIFATILNGSAFKKAGKYSARSILAGNLRIEPENVSLGVKDFEIDIRTAVLQQGKRKNRIIVARPKLSEWKVSFQIVYNEKFIGDPEIIKDCLEDAGGRIGLLEFRPQNSGSFGTFKITKFKVVA